MNKDTSNLSDEPSKNSTPASPKNLLIAKKSLCSKSDKIADALINGLKKNRLKEMLDTNSTLVSDTQTSFKKIVTEDNHCAAYLASRLANIYSFYGLNEEANEYHQIIVDYAEKGEMAAISHMCTHDSLVRNIRGNELTITKDQKLYFCKLIIEHASDDSKYSAVSFLARLYYDESNETALFDLCKKAGKSKDNCLMLYLFPLADKLYKEKKYGRAINFYKQIEPYDTKGNYIVAGHLAEMYAQGKGTTVNHSAAIFWYKQSLKKTHNDLLFALIMNDMGVTYEEQQDFVNAYKSYKQAAIMGNATAQRNLSLSYIKGHGTIQDFQEAYAWLSVAIAQGLSIDLKQAENNRDWLANKLMLENKTGSQLKEAQNRAKTYYKKYVLHEITTENH